MKTQDFKSKRARKSGSKKPSRDTSETSKPEKIDKSSSVKEETKISGKVVKSSSSKEVIKKVAPRNISEWASRYRLRYPVPTAVAEKLLDEGVPLDPIAGVPNGHPISHVYRDFCVLQMLRKEGFEKKELKILDYYGAKRNDRFKPADPLKVTWVNYRPLAVSGDSFRGDVSLDAENCEVALLQDVYMDGKRPLSSRSLLKICNLVSSKVTYVVFRVFLGELGWDECKEGFWFRESGLIHFSPDPREGNYPPHADINFLLNRNFEGLDISPLGKFGPYHMVKVQPSKDQALAVPPALMPPSRFIKRDVNFSLLEKLHYFVMHFSWLSKRQLLVDTHIVSHLVRYQYKKMDGFVFDSVLLAVRTEMQKYQWVMPRAPHLMEEIAIGTAHYICFVRPKERLISSVPMRYLTDFSNPLLGRFREAESSVNLTAFRGKWINPVLALAAGAGVLTLIWKKPKVLFKMVKKFTTVDFTPASAANEAMYNAACHNNPLFVILISPMAEEAVRQYSPKAMAFYGGFEFGLNSYLMSPIQALPAWILHWLLNRECFRDHYWIRLLIHSSFNLFVTRKTIKPDYPSQQFAELYVSGIPIFCVQAGVNPLPLGFRLPAVESTAVSWLDREIKGSFKVKKGGEEIFSSEPSSHVSHYVYPVLTNHRLMHSPSRTGHNLIVALLERVHKFPTYERLTLSDMKEITEMMPDDVKKKYVLRYTDQDWESHDPSTFFPEAQLVDARNLIWREAVKFFSVANLCYITPTSEEEIKQKMGKKFKRIQDAQQDMNDKGLEPFKKTVKVKWDETLPLKTVEGNPSLKPRTIIDLDPKFHALSIPVARSLMESFKEIFSKDSIVVGKYNVRLLYASGASGGKLQTWLKESLHFPGVTIFAAGDDVFLVDNRDGAPFRYVEIDISQADQSQTACYFSSFFAPLLKNCGVPADEVNRMMKQMRDPYRTNLDKEDMIIEGEVGYQLGTGSGYTTFCNTTHTLALELIYLNLESAGFQGSRELSSKLMGVKLKTAYSHELEDVTFLKGVFLMNNSIPVYVPLPGLMLKLGKVLEDPSIICSTTVRGKRKKPDQRTALRRLLFQYSRSYQTVPRDMPVFGDFLRVCDRLGLEFKEVKDGERYNLISYSANQVEKSQWLSFFWKRYGITSEMLDNIKLYYDVIKEEHLPCMVMHKVIDLIADIDYAGDVFVNDWVLGAASFISTLHIMNDNRMVVRAANTGRALARVAREPSVAFSAGALVNDLLRNHGRKAIDKLAKHLLADKPVKSTPSGSDAGLSLSTATVPVAIGYTSRKKPSITKNTKSGIRVKNRELISGAVNGSSTWNLQKTFVLNPGLASTFPWFSAQAQQYEQYQIHGIKFIFVPIVPTSTQGDVIMCLDYNLYDPPPTSETEACDKVGAMTFPVWKGTTMSGNKSDMHRGTTRKFVRSHAVAGDRNLYDSGNFYLSSVNETGTGLIGKLFVEYDIELFVPQINPVAIVPTQTSLINAEATSQGYATAVLAAFTAYTPPASGFDPLGWYNTLNPLTGVFTPPAGCYKIQVTAVMSDTIAENMDFQGYIYKNGAITNFVSHNANPGGAYQGSSVSLQAILAFNGTDTCTVLFRCVGAAGTLGVADMNMVISVA